MLTKSNFVTLVRKSVGNSYGNEEKLTSLLQTFGLENRIVDIENFEKTIDSSPNYDGFDSVLALERLKSIEYLKRNLK